MDELGGEISLTEGNVEYVKQNGSIIETYDETLAFDISNESGNYTFEIKLNNGDIYNAVLNWVKPIFVTGVALSPSELSMNIDDEELLSVEVSPSNADNTNVSFTSSNEDVVSVNSNGLVVALSDGNAVVTVRTDDGEFTDSCNITVLPNIVNVTGVSITPKSIELEVGQTDSVSSNVLPNNADNKNIEYSSDNELVATVSSNGDVEAIGEGSAIITVTTEDGGYTDTCDVTVSESVIDEEEEG